MAAAIHEAVRLSIVPPCQMPPNSHPLLSNSGRLLLAVSEGCHPLLSNSGRLLLAVSEGCCRVHNANIQGIHVKIQPLFP